LFSATCVTFNFDMILASAFIEIDMFCASRLANVWLYNNKKKKIYNAHIVKH